MRTAGPRKTLAARAALARMHARPHVDDADQPSGLTAHGARYRAHVADVEAMRRACEHKTCSS